MKKATFLLLFFTLLLFAQDKKFSVIVDKPFDAALFDITQNYDRTISAVGFSNQNKHNTHSDGVYTNPFEYLQSVSDTYGVQMHLIKVDNKTAKILLSKVAKLPRFNKAVALVKTPTDGYFVGGYTLDGELIVAKLGYNADIEFTRLFGTKNYDRMNNLVLLSDGGVLAVGSSFTSRDTQDDMFQTGLGANDIFITRFSKNGEILWSKKYGTKYDDRGIDAAEASDGSILVVATTAYEKTRDATLMRLTENGNRMWAKHYKSNHLIVPKKIIRLRDNTFLTALQEFNSLQQEHIRLIHFDLYENVIADKKIFTTYPSTLNDIKELSNGTIVGVGYVKDSLNTDALAMLLDPSLVLLRQEHYGNENYDLFNALHILNNSQIAAAGVHTNPDSQETNMWIVKLNPDLSVAQTAQNTLHVKNITCAKLYKELLQTFAQEIKEGKIIINPDLHVELRTAPLYFKQGEYTLTPAQEKFLKRFSQKLFPLLYRYKDEIESFAVNGHTSSEWASQEFSERFLKNEKLSLQRAYAVYSYLFRLQNPSVQKWLSHIIVGSGYSFSKKVMHNNTEEREKSRRVSFDIKLRSKEETGL